MKISNQNSKFGTNLAQICYLSDMLKEGFKYSSHVLEKDIKDISFGLFHATNLQCIETSDFIIP